MVWTILFILINVAILIFALDDLLGEDQLSRIEQRWLEVSLMFFKEWQTGLLTYAGLWKLLALMILSTILVLLPYLLGIILPESFWLSIFSILLTIFTPFLVLSIILSVINSKMARKYLKNHNNRYETKYLMWLKSLPRKAQIQSNRIVELGIKAETVDVPVELPYILAAFKIAITAPIVFLCSIILRGSILIIGITGGSCLFLLPITLKAIASKTGTAHYFKVGKYIILVVMTIFTVIKFLE